MRSYVHISIHTYIHTYNTSANVNQPCRRDAKASATRSMHPPRSTRRNGGRDEDAFFFWMFVV